MTLSRLCGAFALESDGVAVSAVRQVTGLMGGLCRRRGVTGFTRPSSRGGRALSPVIGGVRDPSAETPSCALSWAGAAEAACDW